MFAILSKLVSDLTPNFFKSGTSSLLNLFVWAIIAPKITISDIIFFAHFINSF